PQRREKHLVSMHLAPAVSLYVHPPLGRSPPLCKPRHTLGPCVLCSSPRPGVSHFSWTVKSSPEAPQSPIDSGLPRRAALADSIDSSREVERSASLRPSP